MMSSATLQLGAIFLFGVIIVLIVVFGMARAFQHHRKGLGYALVGVYLISWLVQLVTGWRAFSSDQLDLGFAPEVLGEHGYVWTFYAASFENIMSEFLQLAAFVILTSFLVFEGSAESKDQPDRVEKKIDRLLALQDRPEVHG